MAWAENTTEHNTVKVNVNRYRPAGVSSLELGVTHTHVGIDRWDAKPEAVARAKELLRPTIRWQNTHIIGWGTGDVNPSPGVYRWDSLDARIGLMREIGAPMIVTLCTCPGWMKASGKTWNMEEAPTPEHYDDFARLCVKVAARYPDVRYYQVWNEFKGFWSRELGNWDCERYTTLYNKVYDALKAQDPRLKVGGLYLVIQGDGGVDLGKAGRDTYRPIGERDRNVINYWLANKHGADFICLDRGVKDFHDPNEYTAGDLMRLIHWYGKVGRQVRECTSLPIWWSEYYGCGVGGTKRLAAAFASIYRHMIGGDASVALLWNPNQGEGEIGHYLFTDVRKPDGGRPVPHYEVFRMVAEHFAAGTELCAAESSSEDVEVLASAKKTMLINKRPSPVTVGLNGKEMTLAAYEVRLVNTPSSGRRRSYWQPR